MNDFYPTYKSKLEPWIKFWILKGNKILPKVLSEVIEGTTPITIEGVYKGTSLQDLIFKGQTVQNGTPSPEAPIPVQVVKEDNYININEDSYRVDLGGTQLFNINATPSRVGGSTTYSLNNGILNVSGNWFIAYLVNVTENTDYYISAEREIISGTVSGNISIYDKQISTVIKNGGRDNFTFNSGNNTVVSIVLYSGNGSAGEVNFSNIMLNTGTTEKQYSPYVANPIELCKIGDYQDRIYKENGKWYIEKKIGKIGLNENSNIVKYDNNGRYYISGILATKGSTSSPNAMSNYFKGVFATSNGNIFSSGVDGTINMINTSYLNDLAGFKTWLGTTTPIIYYVLANPIATEITETTLLSQLEAIKNETLISGTNEITQTPSDLPFILNFKYYMKG